MFVAVADFLEIYLFDGLIDILTFKPLPISISSQWIERNSLEMQLILE